MRIHIFTKERLGADQHFFELLKRHGVKLSLSFYEENENGREEDYKVLLNGERVGYLHCVDDAVNGESHAHLVVNTYDIELSPEDLLELIENPDISRAVIEVDWHERSTDKDIEIIFKVLEELSKDIRKEDMVIEELDPVEADVDDLSYEIRIREDRVIRIPVFYIGKGQLIRIKKGDLTPSS
ncbi:hypothetical protein BCF55_0987 [Hydrogenivirga caldilitoris]|uniref:Uncharacterized protein n=1 Tax=Hydrogenivirga caldilitoris TaxID=246264 RepID=A0A497XP06_9AQUI|nr:hypothetical protein [Hydrogenivirga caldilitoris]RLJ70706.1 hypothetical protein BCF55_0987 [Hydrogenivirga caldilitoris]